MNEYETALFKAEVSRQQQRDTGWRMKRNQGWRVFDDMSALRDVIESERTGKLALISIWGTARTIDFITHAPPVFPDDNTATPVEELRWCSSCSWKRGALLKDAFSPDGSRRLGVRRYCKACEADKAKQRREDKKVEKWKNGHKRAA